MPSESVEEWLTYKEQLSNEHCNGVRIIHLAPEAELEARRLQNETERNKKAKNE